jgi:hypothetical protein
MQLPLPEFLESPAQERVAAVWSTLHEEHRAVVVARVARLIVKLVAAQRPPTAVAEQETDHA